MRPLALALAALAANAAVLTATPVFAAPRTFDVAEDRHSLNEALFHSRAAVVRMTGRTNQASGSAKLDLNDLLHAQGKVVLPVGTFDTGIAKRNEHMQSMIEATKYPTATLTFTSIKVPGNKLLPNKPATGTAIGQMTFHGVTRPVTVPIELTYLPQQDPNYRPGDWLQVTSQFKLKLSDYGVNLPTALLGLKVADDLAVEINGMAKAQ